MKKHVIDGSASKAFVKSEINNLKEVVNDKFERIYTKFDEVETRLASLENRIPENLTLKLDKILEQLDGISGEHKKVYEEHLMLSGRVYQDHETRITKLEKKSFEASQIA